jgi:hypothetical protein
MKNDSPGGKTPETFYEALYCWCIHEGGFITISLHRTEDGAKQAIEAHKQKMQEEGSYASFSQWDVQPITIQP